MSESKRKRGANIDGSMKNQSELQCSGIADLHAITEQHLPPELWELVFKNVESPKDLLSCWNAASAEGAWATALRSTDLYFKMTLPFVLPYFKDQDLLECSKVSRFWCATVDICIQIDQEFQSDTTYMWNYGKLIPFHLHKRIEFKNNTPIANPVKFRKVLVKLLFGELSNDQQEPEHNQDPVFFNQRKLFKCLDHCGHLIHRLHIIILNEENVSCVDKVRMIQHCLERTPNLRVVNIEPFWQNFDVAPDGNQPAALNYLSENPWPSLKHLKALNVLHYADFERAEYGNFVNAYGPQLYFLHFGNQHVEPKSLIPERFSWLKKIIFSISSSCSSVEFGAFLKSSHCQLKHLTILFTPCANQDSEKCIELSMAVNVVSATLERLVLRQLIPPRVNFCINKFERLHLPKLNELGLNSFGYPSVGFLKSVAPALRQLTLNPSLPDYSSLNMFETGKMYSQLHAEHTFWNELPEIEMAKVKGIFGSVLVNGGIAEKVYTRREYHNRCLKAAEMKSRIDFDFEFLFEMFL